MTTRQNSSCCSCLAGCCKIDRPQQKAHAELKISCRGRRQKQKKNTRRIKVRLHGEKIITHRKPAWTCMLVGPTLSSYKDNPDGGHVGRPRGGKHKLGRPRVRQLLQQQETDGLTILCTAKFPRNFREASFGASRAKKEKMKKSPRDTTPNCGLIL